MIESIVTGIVYAVVFFFVIAFMSALMAFPTMLLWNWLMPDLFSLKSIGFLQAMGVNVLSALLFKSGGSSK